ncbi:GPGG-motif small membrane protein [Actinocatenispora thailandica]|nr:GPGG-motif small membrane protein [Actinocatenispora thailandica]
MTFLLWILAVILVVAGVASLLRRRFLWGVALIVIGLLVGPGGVSIFT